MEQKQKNVCIHIMVPTQSINKSHHSLVLAPRTINIKAAELSAEDIAASSASKKHHQQHQTGLIAGGGSTHVLACGTSCTGSSRDRHSSR